MTLHRIELPKDCIKFRAQPYIEVFIERHFEAQRHPELSIIGPFQSEWTSPVLLVSKLDVSERFFVEYRRLNKTKIKDSYHISEMEDYLDSLGQAEYFPTFDANCGSWKVDVHEDSQLHMAFELHPGCFQHKRMPFGLCNVSAVFEQTVDKGYCTGRLPMEHLLSILRQCNFNFKII